ncbi:glycoprotein [Citrus leprosis virus N]|uniref:Glycoprotein n=1 Tax=Citrus leprosis virus N TaxID=1956177 RepID=A0A1S5VFF6_9RHAB|nr:glycoprotein [Citrus leprosis virus N]AQN78365.1 glycoprotein [Citrus leprosis virus N]
MSLSCALIYLSSLFIIRGITGMDIVPNTVCSHLGGIHHEEFQHLCLGACESSSSTPDMTKYLVMMSSTDGFKAYGYKITLKRRTVSSHTSFFGECQISASVVDAEPGVAGPSLIKEIIAHGGPGGSMDFTREPSCNYFMDHEVSGILVDYHRSLMEVKDSPKNGYDVTFLESGAQGSGLSGHLYSGNILFAWDITDQIPKCKFRVVGSTMCKITDDLVKCKGEEMKNVESLPVDCGIQIHKLNDGTYIGESPSRLETLPSSLETSIYGLYQRVNDIEGILCQHLCQEVEADGIMQHNEFLMTTPIGNWLSVKADDHRMMYQCVSIVSTITTPPVICGSGPLVQVMMGNKPVWWNVSSPYINPDTSCIPGLSTEMIVDGRIKTWLGEVKLGDNGYTFVGRYTDVHYHPAFRPSQGMSLVKRDDLTPLVHGLVAASKVTYVKHNLAEHSSSMGSSILRSVVGAFDAAVGWVQGLWPSLKAWVIKLILWTILILIIILIIWFLVWLIKLVIKRRLSPNPVIIHQATPNGENTSLMEWAKQK